VLVSNFAGPNGICEFRRMDSAACGFADQSVMTRPWIRSLARDIAILLVYSLRGASASCGVDDTAGGYGKGPTRVPLGRRLKNEDLWSEETVVLVLKINSCEKQIRRFFSVCQLTSNIESPFDCIRQEG
jgi:hypothetical protein